MGRSHRPDVQPDRGRTDTRADRRDCLAGRRVALAAMAVLLALCCPACADPITDPMGPGRVDYLIIAPEALAEPCEPLLELRRQQGLATALVTTQSLVAAMGRDRLAPADIVAFLTHAAGDWGLRFVLLVGDAVGPEDLIVPMSVEPGGYFSDRFLSERELATDYLYSALGQEEPVLYVGRFPAGTPEELAAMVGKTIAYETETAPGPWQRKLSFVTGNPGFDPFVDAVITGLFIKLVSAGVPASYDVEVADARPDSLHCTYPPEFNSNALRLLGEGALLYVYAGHGTPTGCDDLKWQGQTYPILEAADLAQVDIEGGAPLMVAIACHTGRIDWPKGDSLGEQVMKLPRGPVAYLGASRVCQPYGNAVLAQAILNATFETEAETVGEMLALAKRETLQDQSTARQQADTLGATVQGADSLPGMRRDVVRHYNLLGDPALRLRRPLGGVQLQAQPQGGTLRVTGTVPLKEGELIVSLEVGREAFVRRPGRLPAATDPGLGDAMRRRYAEANDKAVARLQRPFTDGAFSVELPLPQSLAPGKYHVKVFAWNEEGAAAGAEEYIVAEL